MTVYIENEQDKLIPFDYENLLKRVIEATVDYVKCPYEAEVSVVITDNDSIHETNLNFRQIDRPTDVLSFPMKAYTKPVAFEELEDDQDSFHPETGELLLGDIMISYDKVMEQAESYQHSLEREIAFLTVHSMLHLFGFDHEEDGQREKMEQLQREILDLLGITR